MDANNQHSAVVRAFTIKAQRISSDIERMARFGREWIPSDDILSDLWLAQKLMFRIASKLSPKPGDDSAAAEQ